jgi:hypothetical protein
MEVYVSSEILLVLERIFDTCVKWNIQYFEFLGETKAGYLLGKWQSRLLQEIFD